MLHRAFDSNLSIKATLFNEGTKSKMQNKKEKFLHEIKSLGLQKNINHFTSEHVREVQYSDFIVLDSNDCQVKVKVESTK